MKLKLNWLEQLKQVKHVEQRKWEEGKAIKLQLTIEVSAFQAKLGPATTSTPVQRDFGHVFLNVRNRWNILDISPKRKFALLVIVRMLETHKPSVRTLS